MGSWLKLAAHVEIMQGEWLTKRADVLRVDLGGGVEGEEENRDQNGRTVENESKG